MILKPFKVHSPDGKHFYEGDAPAPVVRPVTPLICPKCNALWLFWPKEQTGDKHDSLNLRSEKSRDFCEPAGAEQLKSLNRVAPTVLAPIDRANLEAWILRAQVSLRDGHHGAARIHLEAALQVLHAGQS